jgi:hypothetical protein
LGFRGKGLGKSIQGSEFRIWDEGFSVKGSGFRVQGLRIKVYKVVG